MKRNKLLLLLLLTFTVLSLPQLTTPLYAADAVVPDLLGDDEDAWDEDFDDEGEEPPAADTIADPLEPMNRFFFSVNNHLYDWVLKPVSDGYGYVVPVGLRGGIDNFFSNLGSPLRLANALLQGDFDKSGIILERFAINTTAGVFGLADVADQEFDIKKQRADFAQTLGVWGVGSGFYLYLPVIGSSSLRGITGWGVEAYTSPTSFLIDDYWTRTGIYTGKSINWLSLNPGMVEELRKAAFDPYIATRQAWYEYREGLVEKGRKGEND